MTNAIAHVTVRKCHHRQNEIIIFFTLIILEAAKLLFFLPTYKRMLCEKAVFIVSAQVYAVPTGLRYMMRAYIA